MMVRARWMALGLAALAATFWLGARLGAPAGGERVIVERPVAAAPTVIRSVASAPGLTRDDIRAVVREELAQHAAEPTPASEAAPRATSPERVGQVRAAVEAAQGVVIEGVERGVWGDRERTALRTQLIQLGAAETREVLTPLFQAINTQRLQLDGPPI
jgi:hypothetical protein